MSLWQVQWVNHRYLPIFVPCRCFDDILRCFPNRGGIYLGRAHTRADQTQAWSLDWCLCSYSCHLLWLSGEHLLGFHLVQCVFFQCHVSVIPIYSCMKQRNIKQFTIATSSAIAICVFVYTGAATFGYLTFGSKVDDDIISNYSANKPTVMVALIAMAAKTYTTYPILLFCGRFVLFLCLSLWHYIFSEKGWTLCSRTWCWVIRVRRGGRRWEESFSFFGNWDCSESLLVSCFFHCRSKGRVTIPK